MRCSSKTLFRYHKPRSTTTMHGEIHKEEFLNNATLTLVHTCYLIAVNIYEEAGDGAIWIPFTIKVMLVIRWIAIRAVYSSVITNRIFLFL